MICPGEAGRVRKRAESKGRSQREQVRPRWEQRKWPSLGGVEEHSSHDGLTGSAEKREIQKHVCMTVNKLAGSTKLTACNANCWSTRAWCCWWGSEPTSGHGLWGGSCGHTKSFLTLAWEEDIEPP